jgi:putative two-component system response regulator
MQSPKPEATILVVDDTPENLSLMGGLLRDQYRVKVANSGEKALRVARGEDQPDLILLDIMMPGMDGYEVCRQLKADPATRAIPVIFLTARTDPDDERKGLDLGAVDYIIKPISPPLVLARVRNHLALKSHADFLRDKTAWLERDVRETGNHIRRTQNYVKALAEALAPLPAFAPDLTPTNIDLLYKSAPLHDIGKVGVPDAILLKPGRLTADEFEIMKTHASLGADAIREAETMLDGTQPSFLRYAREIAETHHEKWDGSGYPRGLAGDAIPLSGRLMAVADVYDALISKRCYKPAWTHEQAVEMIAEGRGKHFDPRIVDAFLAIADTFKTIAENYRDEDAAA